MVAKYSTRGDYGFYYSYGMFQLIFESLLQICHPIKKITTRFGIYHSFFVICLAAENMLNFIVYFIYLGLVIEGCWKAFTLWQKYWED